MKHFKLILLVSFILFMMPVFICAKSQDNKPSIYTATQTQINTSSDLIGEQKSLDIYFYVQANNIQHVSELKGKIPHVGKETIKDLEKKYK